MKGTVGMTSELIIFGRSPFINKINFDKIDYDRFDICCINGSPPMLKRIDYVVSADDFCIPYVRPESEWVSVHSGWKLIKHEARIIQQEKELSWKHLSSDLAVNFALLRGYKTIYLAGIDLVEDNKPFYHWDGVMNKRPQSAAGARDEKEFIKLLGRRFGANIYQLNPDSDWLEFKDLGIL